jgi:hypothetical protein
VRSSNARWEANICRSLAPRNCTALQTTERRRYSHRAGWEATVDVAAWLKNLDLGQYENAFRDNGIGEAVLPHLTVDDDHRRRAR